MIITDLENTSKVEEVCDQCPTLTCRLVVDAELEGWASLPYELLYPALVSHRS
jgi:acetyl-CoA synthetase